MVAWPKMSGGCWPGWHGWRARCWHSEILSVHSLCHHAAPSPFLSEAVCSWFCTSKKYLSTWCVFQGFLLCSQEVTWVVSTNGIKDAAANNALTTPHCALQWSALAFFLVDSVLTVQSTAAAAEQSPGLLFQAESLFFVRFGLHQDNACSFKACFSFCAPSIPLPVS